MTPTQQTAMRVAIDAFQTTNIERHVAAIGALRAALAEPVAWKHDCAALLTNDVELWIDHCPHCGKPRTKLTASPQPPADVPLLTDGNISWLWSEAHNDTTDRMPFQVFARAIEQAVRNKAGII